MKTLRPPRQDCIRVWRSAVVDKPPRVTTARNRGDLPDPIVDVTWHLGLASSSLPCPLRL